MQAPRQRIDWIDATRGFAILLVVMHHAGSYERALFQTEATAQGFWTGIELLLYHLRMPLFFFVSGTVASGIHARGHGGPRSRSALRLAYIYCVWAVVLTFAVPSWPRDGFSLAVTPAQIASLLIGSSVAWYLWAVVLSFAVAFATRRAPAMLVVAASALLCVLLLSHTEQLSGGAHSWLRVLPFYLLGFRYPTIGARIVALSGFRVVTFPLVVYLSLLGASGTFPIPGLLLDLAGIGIGLLLVGLALRRAPRETAHAAWLGRWTLPIYLLHFPIIAGLGCGALRLLGSLPPSSLLSLAFTPLLVALSVTSSLALYVLIVRLGGRWLFEPPSWIGRIRPARLAVATAPLP